MMLTTIKDKICTHERILLQVREEIEFENLAKIYLREMIKRECWDEMDVKGRAIQVCHVNFLVVRERAILITPKTCVTIG